MSSLPHPPVSVEREFVLRAARYLTHKRESGRFTRPELESAVEELFGWEVHLHTQSGVLLALLNGGRIVQWAAGPKTQYQAVMPMNLHEVLKRGRDRVDENKVASRGRRSGHDPEGRRHHQLTPSQFRDANSGARKLGEAVSPNGNPKIGMQQVGLEYLTWDPDAGIGEIGDWGTALDALRQVCQEEGLSEGATQKYVSGLRTLLDLAATRGWIPRTEIHNPSWERLPSEWADTYEQWREVLLENDERSAGPKVKELLLALSRRGYDKDPAAAPWGDVIDELDAHWEGRDVSPQRRSDIRRSYRVLRREGKLSGPDWDLHRRRREAATVLVPTSARKQMARLFGTDTRQRGLDALLAGESLPWPDAWTPHEELIGGRYSLEDWLAMRSAIKRDDFDQLDLPRRRSGQSALRKGTFARYLHELCYAFGALADECGVNWAEQDLRAIADPARLDAYRTFLEEQTNAGPGTQADRLYTLGALAATMARVAQKREDPDVEAAFEATAELLIGEGPSDSTDKSYVDALRDEAGEGGTPMAEQMKNQAIRVQKVLTNNRDAAEYGYDQLVRLGVHRLELFELDYGPLGEQRSAVVNQDFPYQVEGARKELGRSWAKEARNLMIWFQQLVVPYRTATLTGMDRQDLETARGLKPPITTHVYRKKRKAPNLDWHPAVLCRPEDGPSIYPAELARLYLTEGGPRDVLLTRPDGTRWDPADGDALRYPDEARRYEREPDDRRDGLCEPLFPNSLSEATYARMDGGTVRTAVRSVAEEVLERRPEALGGVSYEELTDTDDGEKDAVLIPHAFRHAYGTWRLLDGGGEEIDEVVQILDHSDPQMLLEVYAGTTPADYNVGAAAAVSLADRGVLDDVA